LTGVAVLIITWGVILFGATAFGLWRARRFESALRTAGFETTGMPPYAAELFGRPEAVLSRVATGTIAGIRITFLFGSCGGRPIALEGIFDVPRVPITAALIETSRPRMWIEIWTTDRAYCLGWRPARSAKVMSDGRILLVWEGVSQQAAAFKRCVLALGRTSAIPEGRPSPALSPPRSIVRAMVTGAGESSADTSHQL
jgi:hypothetical protein